MLEGRNFSIYTDQKPLIYAFKQNQNKCSPRQLRHLDLISQYSTDIRHVQGSQNIVADALSRIEADSITKSPILNFKEFARAQKDDSDIQKFLHNDASSLQLESNPARLPTAICFAIPQLEFHVLLFLLLFENSYLIIYIILRILG
ncbi:hypothetical protein AVEN_157801-1 [Araneus ventricosus]|uniref:Reverse transcriptase RNase H-like domain-containing protein n=1 Tax=Araneus ventricosus TaxID=182803 RepID=A0A4Y2IML6_ARAVE|nr:hypothetical protein AVEN_157801-1 [Araneus ventricosus]